MSNPLNFFQTLTAQPQEAEMPKTEKLIRANVPHLIRTAGHEPIVREVVSDYEYGRLLLSTLIDLTTEYLSTQNRSKLVDMQAVITAIADHEKFNLPRAVKRRAQEYGNYDRLVLEGYK